MARKKKSIQQLTAAEAKAEIARIRARQKEIAARRAEIQPPAPPRPAPPGAAAGGGGYSYDPDPLKGAGPEYRRVILEGSPEDLLRLELELRDLDAEATLLAGRGIVIEQRAKIAQAEEERAAAPGELRQLRREIDDMMADVEAKLAEAKAGLERLSEWKRRALELQELVGDDSAVLDPHQFRRLGLILRHRITEVKTFELESLSAGPKKVPALFASWSDARQSVRLLGAPKEGVLQRLGRYFGGERPSGAEERERRAMIDRERLMLIAGDHLDQLEDTRLARSVLNATGTRTGRELAADLA